MDEVEAGGRRKRWRPGLRGLMALVALIAMALVPILPLLSEWFRHSERYVRVKLNEDDLVRHVDIRAIRRLAEGFAGSVRSGRFEEALERTSAGFRRQTTPEGLRARVAEVGLDRGPCDLLEASTAFPYGANQFISTYQLRCGPESGPHRTVKLVVITEGGALKVDRIEADSK